MGRGSLSVEGSKEVFDIVDLLVAFLFPLFSLNHVEVVSVKLRVVELLSTS